MKKTITLLMILVVSGLAYASNNPSDIIFNYYDALNIGDYKKAYSYLSQERKSVIKENEYVSFHKKAPYKEVYDQFIKYELIKEAILEDTAILELKTKIPAQSIILPIFYSASYMETDTRAGKEELSKFVKKRLKEMGKDVTILYVYGDIVVNMVKENGEWKLAKNKDPQ